MDLIRLSLDVTNRSKEQILGLELWLDQTKFFDNQISPGTYHVIHEFSGEEGEHVLRFVLKNKTDKHTKISGTGEILEDSLIGIGNIMMDGVNIDQMMWTQSEYTHDSNGNGPMKSDRFYGNMGCNGEVRLDFNVPVYLWILENM